MQWLIEAIHVYLFLSLTTDKSLFTNEKHIKGDPTA